MAHDRAVRRHQPALSSPAEAFEQALTGTTIEGVRRRGKFLWLPLDSADALMVHLGMSGQLLLREPDAAPERHLRVRIRFADAGPELRFVDQRTFGHLLVSAGGAALPAEIAHIAPDPFDPEYDQAAVVRAIRSRRSEIKRVILDQAVVSGIGNIYADEALWRARLHYARRADRLRPGAVDSLLTAAAEVMTDAVAAGGTSFDELYVNVNGRSGYFDIRLNVYGRAGHPCPRCGGRIGRERFTNRSSFLCRACQRPPRQHRPA